MRRCLLFVLLFSLAGGEFLFSQVQKDYARFINVEESRKILSVLASDDFEGRETGSAGGQKAAHFLENQFKSIGLKPARGKSFLQKVPLVKRELKEENFRISGKGFSVGKNFYPKLNMEGSGTEALKIKSSNVVFIGYGINSKNYDEYSKLDLENKIVVILNNGEPKDTEGNFLVSQKREPSKYSEDREIKIEEISRKKPALILAYEPRMDNLSQSPQFVESVRKSTMQLAVNSNKSSSDNVPLVLIDSKMFKAIFSHSPKHFEDWLNGVSQTKKPDSFTIKVNVTVNLKYQSESVEAYNVAAYLEGVDKKLKDEVLVISAHYDHLGNHGKGADKIYNGADDDGSGTTALVSLARAFKKASEKGLAPRRSILFLAVTGEEKGLFGSQYYTDFDPIFPLKQTVTDLNIDMIGRVDEEHQKNPNYVYVIGSEMLSRELKSVSEKNNKAFMGLDLDYRYDDPNDPNRFYYRSDHYNFAKHNVPIIFYFNGVHEDYHKVSDEIDKIDFNILVKRAQLVFYTAWDLANRDHRVQLNTK